MKISTEGLPVIEKAVLVLSFLVCLAPLYVAFLRSLRHLSRQKSSVATRISGGASQG